MKFGISPEHYELLEKLVLRPLKDRGARVYIFGSRAEGKHHPYSDVDLLYRSSQALEAGFISSLKENIEESKFPYTVELVNDNELAESYRQSVESQLTEL